MPDSRLRELADLATEALTKFNAKEPSRLDKTKDVVAVMTGLLALATATITGIGWFVQTERAQIAQRQANAAQRQANAADRQANVAEQQASVAERQANKVETTATAGLQTVQPKVDNLIDALKAVSPRDATVIKLAESIKETLTNTQSEVLAPWQVVIGDYKDWDEARRKQDAAQRVGYSNSEIFGQPPHLHMRFRFSTESDAKAAADKLKAARVSHEPDVLHRPNLLPSPTAPPQP